MSLKHATFTLCATAALAALTSFGQDQPKPVVNTDPLTAEQVAVYRAVVSQWIGNDKRHVNLADRTNLPGEIDASERKDCEKGLDLEAATAAVHRIRPEDAELIAPGKFHLIDPDSGSKEVRKNDPENSIRNGGSVDSAVENGFAHGMFSLGEIRCDKSHTHAIVSFSFVCGGLCGHGATVVMKKTAKGWERSNDCENWISCASPIRILARIDIPHQRA